MQEWTTYAYVYSFERENPHEFLQPSASLAVTKKLSKSIQWTSNLATAWRPPTLNEWYSRGVHHGAATYEIGDTSLVQEVSYSWSNQLLLDVGRWNAEAEVYVNFMDGFINQQAAFPATLTIRGAFPTFRYEQTDALQRRLGCSDACGSISHGIAL